MKNFRNLTTRLSKNEEGATAIEYGLLAALISVAIITVVGNIGTTLDGVFTRVDTDLKAAIAPTP